MFDGLERRTQTSPGFKERMIEKMYFRKTIWEVSNWTDGFSPIQGNGRYLWTQILIRWVKLYRKPPPLTRRFCSTQHLFVSVQTTFPYSIQIFLLPSVLDSKGKKGYGWGETCRRLIPISVALQSLEEHCVETSIPNITISAFHHTVYLSDLVLFILKKYYFFRK